MTRPRHKPIVINAEKQMERLREKYSRRQILQLFGATGGAALAGCGGGGGEGTPTKTETPTGTPTGTETPTETETPGGGQGTPTETPEPTPTATPASQIEVTDQLIHDVTTANFEQIQPNEWNAETGGNPVYQEFALGGTSPTLKVDPGVEGALDTILLMAAREVSLDTQSRVLTLNLRDDLTWGDGTPFTAQNVKMHFDILAAQVELGEQAETALPQSTKLPDKYTVEMKLLPGNPIIRMFEALWNSPVTDVSNTHPKLHKKFVENIRNATTLAATKKAIQKLLSATFPASDLPKMALGPFQASDWNPSEMKFKPRKDWPWGLDYHPDQDRVFKGVRWFSVSEEQNVVNAAVNGKKDWILLPSLDVFDRFKKDKWTTFHEPENAAIELFFSQNSKFGQKTEKARKMRQAVGYLMDAKEFAGVNQLIPAYEQSTGFAAEENFKNWIGNDFFFENFTNYGHQDRQYVYKQKGYQKFREAGFERNKSGVWVDTESGEPLAPTAITAIQPDDGLVRPVLENGAEQLSRHGINVNFKIVEENDQFQNTLRPSKGNEFDITILNSQAEMFPTPYAGFSEDTGLGSLEGLPAGINSWDWRNGIRRVEIPMPVGNPDGDLQTFDWDKNVNEMVQFTSQEKMRKRVRTLSWVLNQWMPGVILVATSVRGAIRAPDRISIADDWTPKYFGEFGKPNFNFGGGFFQPP